MTRGLTFLKRFSWPFGLCGGFYALIAANVDNYTVSATALGITVTIFVAILLTCLIYINEAGSTPNKEDIIVEKVLEKGRVFLLRSTQELGQNMGAMIFTRDGDYELQIGRGQVLTVQNNGLIQLKFHPESASEEFLEILAANDRETLKKLIIRPGVIMNSYERSES